MDGLRVPRASVLLAMGTAVALGAGAGVAWADEGKDEGGAATAAEPAPAPAPGPAPEPQPAPAADPSAAPPAAAAPSPAAAEPAAEPAAAPAPAPAPARTKFTDWVDTVITFYVGDDNVLAGVEERSPNVGIATLYPELFFEGLNAEKRAVVSESQLALYGRMPGFIPILDTEAAFVVELEVFRDPESRRVDVKFKDDGSYVQATFWFSREKKGKHLKFVGWPVSADRMRLGYLYDLTWGGDRLWVDNTQPVPGAKLHVDLERFYAYVGAKSLVQPHRDTEEVQSYWGILGGLGPNAKFGPGEKARLSYDLGAGYFTRGTFDHYDFDHLPVRAFGFSHRLQFTWNHAMGASPDLKLFVNDPEQKKLWSNIPKYEGNFGFGVSGELSTVFQSLIDFENTDSLVWQPALAAALTGQVRLAHSMRVGVDVVYRDVSFLLFNVPGLTPYLTFPEGTTQRPQLYGALFWDWYLEKPHLTPGFVIGLMQPASNVAAEAADGTRQVEVIRDADDVVALPVGVDPFTVLSLKGSLKWHLSHMLAAIGEVSFTQDWNQVRYQVGEDGGPAAPVLDEARARALGLNLLLQARF
jgi:hypothetical protein